MDFNAEYATGLIRGLHAVGVLSLFGIFVFRVTVACPLLPKAPSPALDKLEARLLLLSWFSLVLAVLTEFGWLGDEAVSMSGLPPLAALSPKILGKVLLQTVYGEAWLARLGFDVLLALLLFARGRFPGWQRGIDGAGVALSGATLVALAFVSHAASLDAGERVVMVAVQAVHLLGAGGWLGALLPLFFLLQAVEGGPKYRGPALDGMACQRFSSLGIVCVSAIAASALANSILFVGGVAGLFGTLYGILVLVKLTLFLGLIGFAAWNRFHWTPRLFLPQRKNRGVAAAGLRRSIVMETCLGILVLLVAGLLGSTPPAVHSQPWWPFSFRLSSAALELPAVYNEVLIAGIGAVIGVFVTVGGVLSRRYRLVLGAVGVLVTAFFVSTPLQLLSVTAYPTSFYHSPTRFTVHSVAEGGQLFGENCTACHGPDGKGDGPRAKSLAVPPADLTAEHVRDHPDGDLFWWITAGTDNGVMPPFAGVIGEKGRWELVDFVHAWNGAALLATPPEKGEEEKAILAPDFRFDCPDGTQRALREPAADKVVALIFTGEPDERLAEMMAEVELAERLAEVKAIPVLGLEPGDPQAASLRQRYCVADSRDLAAAYALYTPSPRDSSGLRGQVFLIDRDGWLRDRREFKREAMKALQTRIKAITAKRLPPPTGGGHVHGH